MKRLSIILCASLLAVVLVFGVFAALAPIPQAHAATGEIHLTTSDGSVFTLTDPPPGDTGLRNYTIISVENMTDALVRVYHNADCSGVFISIPSGGTGSGFPFAPQCLRVSA